MKITDEKTKCRFYGFGSYACTGFARNYINGLTYCDKHAKEAIKKIYHIWKIFNDKALIEGIK